jgi:hypothetical protein
LYFVFLLILYYLIVNLRRKFFKFPCEGTPPSPRDFLTISHSRLFFWYSRLLQIILKPLVFWSYSEVNCTKCTLKLQWINFWTGCVGDYLSCSNTEHVNMMISYTVKLVDYVTVLHWLCIIGLYSIDYWYNKNSSYKYK